MPEKYKFHNEDCIYLYNNPVKHGIVFRPEDYVFSSAIDYCGEKGLLSLFVEL